VPIFREKSKQGQELFSYILLQTELFSVIMAKKTMVLGKTHCWTQPRKTMWGPFPKQSMAQRQFQKGTKIQAGLGVQLSLVFVFPWATNRWLQSQSWILVTTAVTWPSREEAELPPLSAPFLCWVIPSMWSPAYEHILLWACFARQQDSPSGFAPLSYSLFNSAFICSQALF